MGGGLPLTHYLKLIFWIVGLSFVAFWHSKKYRKLSKCNTSWQKNEDFTNYLIIITFTNHQSGLNLETSIRVRWKFFFTEINSHHTVQISKSMCYPFWLIRCAVWCLKDASRNLTQPNLCKSSKLVSAIRKHHNCSFQTTLMHPNWHELHQLYELFELLELHELLELLEFLEHNELLE